jgi:hypothetical protein
MLFFRWKDHGRISNQSFNDLRELVEQQFGKDIHDVRVLRRRLATELGVYVQTFDCCIHNCMAFTAEHHLRRKCLYCKALRFRGGGHSNDQDVFDDEGQFTSLKAQATYSYLPIIPRLKLLYANPEWAKHMRYPTKLLAEEWEQSDETNDPIGGIRDVWEGAQMQDLRRRGTCSLCPTTLILG